MKSYKRVLVLSHNAFSKQQNNGKTLEAFFRDWDSNAISQIYLQPEVPDFDFCSNYFRMTDYEVLNSLLSKGKIGSIVTKNEENLNTKMYSPIVSKLYQERRKGVDRKGINKFIHKAFVSRIPIFITAREILWNLSTWKTKHLVDWIKEFSPDVLFFQGSSCVFGYKIALWICEEFKIPLILQLTDDYTSNLYDFSIIEKVNKQKYRKIFKKAISLSKNVIAISEAMADEYKHKYGGKYTVLMNTVNRKITKAEPEGFRLIYAGNVSLNRWEVLEKIGLALDSINNENTMRCSLDIYTPTALQSEVYNRLDKINSISCKGTLNQEELTEQIQNSNILVHVESFDEKMKRITRLSISTKIPEYMASKRCIFAVGPSDVASIKYLSENNYGLVVNTENVDVIKDKLLSIINDVEYKNQIIENAYLAYNAKHHPDFVQQTIYEVIEDACRK